MLKLAALSTVKVEAPHPLHELTSSSPFSLLCGHSVVSTFALYSVAMKNLTCVALSVATKTFSSKKAGSSAVPKGAKLPSGGMRPIKFPRLLTGTHSFASQQNLALADFKNVAGPTVGPTHSLDLRIKCLLFQGAFPVPVALPGRAGTSSVHPQPQRTP